MEIRGVILAAGQGTRMRSKTPKVLHPILGRPLIWYSLQTVEQASGHKPVVVIGHGADQVQRALGEAAEFVIQEPQLGTGHAVWQAEPLLKGKADLILVTYGDMPALSAETLAKMVQAQQSQAGPLTLLTVEVADPRGFGRVVRDAAGQVLEIVEEAQATPEQLMIRELNAGVYCINAEWLWQALPRIPLSRKGEYYLTDLAGLAVAEGARVQAVKVADPDEVIGINNRLHLADATAILRRRINRDWMLHGVTLIDPESTYIEPGVILGQDTVIWPNTYLKGSTQIGEDCVIGPQAVIENTRVGNRCKVFASVLEGALLEDAVDVGPFGHLRKGAHLAEGVHMGNFGEVKNSYLGPGTKMGHFSYLGDATLGPRVNVGAGTITCNYDGKHKFPTEIGEDVFIGSDTMLVAPVKVGEGAKTGAGAVVTKDVQPYTLVVGVPARAIRKLEKND
jgi:bifunctional UDP-N-acetylglucosamine pyrophosphorylase/glucosamine-1-phosphate N-acetyltransferase